MAGTEDIEISVTSMGENVLPRHRKQLSDTDLEIKKVDEDSLRRNQATTWLRKTVGVVAAKDLPAEPSEEDFKLGLRSGNILCNVLNKMPPGSVPKVARSSSEDGENLINFLVVIEEMGFPSFDPCDLEPEGHSSRVVDCVLALKSYSERRGGSASRRFSGSFKSFSSGMPISRKNSEPFSISRSHSLGSETLDKWDQSNLGSDLNGTNSELDSSPLYMLVCDLLADKEEEDIPTIVENLLNKVTEEFERRFEEETKKASIIATQLTKDENRFIQPESPKAQLEDTKRSFSDVYSEKEEEEATPDTKKEEGNSDEGNKAINQQESGNKEKFSKLEGSNKQDEFTGLKEKFTKKQEDTSRELERNNLEEKARKEQEERSKDEEHKKLEEKSKKEEEERRKEEERNKLEEKARIEQEERSKLEEENKLKEKARMEKEERIKEEERNKLQEKARKEEEERRIAEENKRLKEKARREQALRKRREEERRRKREEKKKLKEKARKEREERRKEREERKKEREERRKEERKKKLEERARKEAELKQKNEEYYKIKEAIKEQQERRKEIETNSLKEIALKEEEIRSHEKEYNTLKERISSRRAYVEQQHKDLQGLKNTLSSAKSDLKSMQTKYQEEFNNLGTHVRNLTQAAAGYKKVLEENRKLYNQVQDLKGNIRVYCRVRPLLPGSENNMNIVDYIDNANGTITVIAPLKTGNMGRRSFFLNKVFGSSATQEEVFSDTQPLIRSVLDGFNVCIFAYGQTGAGKTYTLSGPDDLTPETMGVNYRALDDLFEISEQRKNLMAYEISVNMLSICDEDIRDLLVTDGSDKSLEIRSGASNGINVPDANRVPITSTDEVKNLMNLSQKNQAAMNDPSTSSHRCLTVHVFGKDLTSRATVRGCMHLVDLAGSENTSKSLSALGDVIAALSHKSSNVPYKNSKLTQFLQDALGSQAKTLMFVHICPDMDAIGDTLNTLKFGERVSMDSGKDTAEARDLKEHIANLKAALTKKDVGGLDQDSMVNSPRAGDKQNSVCDDDESVEESKPKSSSAKQEKAPPSRTAVTKKPAATASTASKTAKAQPTVDPKKKKVAK